MENVAINLVSIMLEKAKIIEKNLRDSEQTLEKQKEIMFEALKKKYGLLLDDNKKADYQLDTWEFNAELNLILRAMLKKNEVYKLSDTKCIDRWYLTQQHGLKFPRCHSYHHFLPSGRTTDAPILDGMIYDSGYDKIVFSSLSDHVDIDQTKFQKFIYFLKEVLSLWKKWGDLTKDMTEEGDWRKLDLSCYSDLDQFEKFIKEAPKVNVKYLEWVSAVEKFNNEKKTLMNEMHEFNKPYRVFLELKKADGATL